MNKFKVCQDCNKNKSIDCFYIRQTYKNGIISYRDSCIECINKLIDPSKRLKECIECQEIKDISLFPIHSINKEANKIFHRPQCIVCFLFKKKIYREENKEELSIKRKLNYSENKEEIDRKQRENSKIATEEQKRLRKNYIIKYNEKNKEHRSIYNKEYRSNPQNKKHIIEYQIKYQSEYYQKNKQEKRKKEKERNKNPDVKLQRNKKERERKQKNPILKINKNISRTINSQIRKNGGKKNGSKSKYLPWTFDEFKEYFEFLFTLPGNEWMTWENYGKEWHIDHIKPKSHFKIDSQEHPDFQECWSLDNLRPLEAKQNISEGNRRTEEEIREILDYIQTAKNKLKKKEDK